MSISGQFVLPILIFSHKSENLSMRGTETYFWMPQNWYFYYMIPMISDGYHSQEWNINFVDIAKTNQVTVIIRHRHCTHKLNPLDTCIVIPTILIAYKRKENINKYQEPLHRKLLIRKKGIKLVNTR